MYRYTQRFLTGSGIVEFAVFVVDSVSHFSIISFLNLKY